MPSGIDRLALMSGQSAAGPGGEVAAGNDHIHDVKYRPRPRDDLLKSRFSLGRHEVAYYEQKENMSNGFRLARRRLRTYHSRAAPEAGGIVVTQADTLFVGSIPAL